MTATKAADRATADKIAEQHIERRASAVIEAEGDPEVPFESKDGDGADAILVDDAGRPIPTLFADQSAEQQRIHRKINLKGDLFLLPVLAAYNFFNGLDKGNVGNAQSGGLSTSIGISPDAVNNAVTLFYITFIIFQPINAGIGKQIGVKRWISALTFAYGIVTLAHAWVTSEGSLIGLRLLVGLFESGIAPLILYYMSLYYHPFDLGKRVGVYYALSAIAGCWSGAIAYGILVNITGPLPYAWQYIFVIEGTLTAGFAIFGFFYLPSDPRKSWFLNDEETEYIAQRVEFERAQISHVQTSREDIMEGLKDWKTWAILPFGIMVSIPAATLPIFLPLVLRGFGYSGIKANLYTVPPNIVGVVGLLLFTYSSDRFKERGYHLMASISISILGLILVCVITGTVARYVCLCILLFGSLAVIPVLYTWIANNTPVPGKRAVVMGIMGWNYLSGVLGAQLYRSKYAPRYLTPFYVNLALAIVGLAGFILYRLGLSRVNKRRAAIVARMSPEELYQERTNSTRKGDTKYTFIYGL